MDANHIKQVIARYWAKKLWATHFEIGLCKQGRLRADIVAISMRSEIVIIEVKRCRLPSRQKVSQVSRVLR